MMIASCRRFSQWQSDSVPLLSADLRLTQLLEQSMEELCESQVEVPECFTPEKLKQEAALPHMQSTPTLPSAFRIPENRGRCSVLTCKRPAAELVESLDLSWEAVWPQLEAQGAVFSLLAFRRLRLYFFRRMACGARAPRSITPGLLYAPGSVSRPRPKESD
ncbi:unnamed protein product [Effrenium voratum]|nr:unnamed protein product [Effrenium voratum]